MADTVGEGEDIVLVSAEEVADVWAQGAGAGEQEDVVGLGGGEGVVVEVVDDEGGAVGGEVDVQLEEEGNETRWGWVGGRESEEDVAFGIDEFE